MNDRTILAVDTSVAVPLMVATHSAHRHVIAWARGLDLSLCGHAVAETYSVLTRLPGDVRVDPADAIRLIDANFTRRESGEQAGLIDLFATAGVAGGAVYDGMVAAAALHRDMALATRDARARATYEALGVRVVMIR